jgi:hypothetical protein
VGTKTILSSLWSFREDLDRDEGERNDLTSEIVFIRVKGINKKPTPVLAVLPTSKSPVVVNLTFPPRTLLEDDNDGDGVA